MERAGLDAKCVIIGSQDLWIGSAAIAHGFTLVTHNLRDFRRIPGLKLGQWPGSE
ncbi:MAG TPA: hypothetical protein PLU72_12120 [Candidatus Ozemobacteraceae bacterium]|nr:hypothetical protein [Candidatus Ozemobacteraceae bacterium]HQG27615.1 hypothetical protein [Candidatus Ozemobacteraceae bacterium]